MRSSKRIQKWSRAGGPSCRQISITPSWSRSRSTWPRAATKKTEGVLKGLYKFRASPIKPGERGEVRVGHHGEDLGGHVPHVAVLPDGRVESTGNFHGEPLAFAADFLAIAADTRRMAAACE